MITSGSSHFFTHTSVLRGYATFLPIPACDRCEEEFRACVVAPAVAVKCVCCVCYGNN